jgi:hypothetical protein
LEYYYYSALADKGDVATLKQKLGEMQYALAECQGEEITGLLDIAFAHLPVYPNPTTGIITISGLEKGDNIYLYTLDGKLLATFTASGETTVIDLSYLSSTVYILRSKLKSTRLIKIWKSNSGLGVSN